MEETIVRELPTTKIYKDRAILLGTFIGGPLAAGYLIAENFKTFNNKRKANYTWIISIIATVLIFGSIFLIPDNSKIPNQLIPFTYTIVIYYLTQHFQGKNIIDHLNAGGQFFIWWRTIVIGLIGLIITLIPIIAFALISDGINDAAISTKTYGSLKHEIAFDKSNISEMEINQLAEGFIKTTFFDDAMTKFVYATKVNDTYELKLSVVDGMTNNQDAMQPFIDLRTDLQSMFPHHKIVFKLIVDDIDNVVKTIE